MYNLQQIIDRYKNKINRTSVNGYLSWGGKSYYEINSQVETSLNSTYEGFILNENNQVQLTEVFIEENGDQLGNKCYRDPEFTIEISEEELWNEGLLYENEDYFRNWNAGIKHYWGKTLDNYYPHIWYPEKEIKGYEIIRNLPGVFVGDIIYINGNFNVCDPYTSILINGRWYSQEYCLSYPEFFRPIYND